MKVKIILTISVALLFFSCKKTVTLKLNNVPPAIVIQGEVSDASGPYTVTINKPVDFYADNTFPPISGATVTITDGHGVSDLLTETSPGIYSTHTLVGIQGYTYTLTAEVQGQNYTAVSTMPENVNLDSVTFQTNSGFGKTRISAIANFQDPPNIKNYYQFVEYINGVQLTKDLFVFDDRLSDGRYISNTLYNDSSYLVSGDQLQVNMYGVDSNVYNYFYQLNQSNSGGTSDASPANPTSNISNGAYGYFSAHTLNSVEVIVP
jgi:Domain of unknown function (DUF4249)